MTKRSIFKGAANRDDNEPEFAQLLDAYRIQYAQGKPGDGYDLLIQMSPMQLWEIKNPLQPRSKRKLTAAEQAKKEYCEATGIPYYVLEYVDQAQVLIEIWRAHRKIAS